MHISLRYNWHSFLLDSLSHLMFSNQLGTFSGVSSGGSRFGAFLVEVAARLPERILR